MTGSVLSQGLGSFGGGFLLTQGLGAGAAPEPVVDNGWLGGGVSDAYYHLRKKQLEELDRIDENIRRGKKEAIRALTAIEVPESVKAPEIKGLDRELLRDLRKLKKSELNIQALLAEIALLREYLLAQQLFDEMLARELDDEAAFLLMLN